MGIGKGIIFKAELGTIWRLKEDTSYARRDMDIFSVNQRLGQDTSVLFLGGAGGIVGLAVEYIVGKHGFDLSESDNQSKMTQFPLVWSKSFLEGEMALAAVIVIIDSMMAEIIVVHVFQIINLDKVWTNSTLAFCLGERC